MTNPFAPTPFVPDVVCFDDVDDFARETQSPLESLKQDIYHRLIETPGSNADDPTLGIGVELMLSGSDTSIKTATVRIEQELLKDDRIDAVAATLTVEGDGSYLLALVVQSKLGQFNLGFDYQVGKGLSLHG